MSPGVTMGKRRNDNASRTEKPQQDSLSTAAAPNPTAPPPDGGLVAWLQVVGAAFLFFNSW